jgi:hypothetical protein
MQIINLSDDDWQNRGIWSFEVYNDKIFLNVSYQWLSPSLIWSIYVYNLTDDLVYPLMFIDNNKTQTYRCKEMGYELSYPIGYVIQFDPASYYSGRTLFTNPSSGIFINVMNHGYFYGVNDDNHLLKGTKIVTDEGIEGAYNLTNLTFDREAFRFGCSTVNGFVFGADGCIDDAAEAEEVFINMIRSFKVLD